MINTLIEYELYYMNVKNGKRGKCVVEARELMEAIYAFYQAHGLKYRIITWSIKRKDL